MKITYEGVDHYGYPTGGAIADMRLSQVHTFVQDLYRQGWKSLTVYAKEPIAGIIDDDDASHHWWVKDDDGVLDTGAQYRAKHVNGRRIAAARKAATQLAEFAADGHPAELRQLLALEGQLHACMHAAVIKLREQNYTWADIAVQAGIDRLTVQKRWARQR